MRKQYATAVIVVLMLSMCCGPVHAAFGGGALGFAPGVPDPLKYYPVCPRGRTGDSCQCQVAGTSEANRLCMAGEYCDTRSGTCGPMPPGRTRSR
jgi:hypothetical protein